MIVASTGHRPDKIGGYDLRNPVAFRIRQRLRQQLTEIKPRKAISGMALGVDQLAAEVCIELDLPFIAAVPFKGQENKWPVKSQLYYWELMGEAAETVVVCEGGYAAWKMQVRNAWMVDHCDILLAVWDGTAGGTANCVRYAQTQKKQILRLDPTTGEWSGELDLELLRVIDRVRDVSDAGSDQSSSD